VTHDGMLDGPAYLAGLVDGREVWFDGERVKDVTAHPAFRNAARSIARLYDLLHEPSTRDRITTTDREGTLTHAFFAPAYDADDLLASREAIAIWQRSTYGWMGRTPDYKAAFMAQLAEGHGFYGEYAQNALDWYRRCARSVLYMNHVLIDPPVDRHLPRSEAGDVYVRLDREEDGGIRVSGAKMVATASALTHATFVAVNSGTAARMEAGRDEDMALVFIADMASPGLKLVSRPSYELGAHPFNAPLAARFDENDAVMVFDDALIPWENVLVYRDVERTKGFYAESGFFNRYNFQASIRLATKLDFCIGLLQQGTAATGTGEFRGVQVDIGELVAMRDLIWALSSAMAHDPEPGIGESVVPRLQTAAAARVYMTNAWQQVRDIFERTLAGAPTYTVAGPGDLTSPELKPLIDRYYRGAGLSGPERIKLFKLIWDALYSEFAGRHALYERNYAGNQDQQRLDALRWSQARGDADRRNALVEECLADFDLTGWLAPHLRD